MDPAAVQKKLQAMFGNAEANRTGGKGTPRRKRKAVAKAVATDDKKIQAALTKLGSQPLQNIEAVEFHFVDKVVSFKAPKVQAVLQSNLFAISGLTETKAPAFDPEMFKNMDPETMAQLQRMLQARAGEAAGDEDIPDLVENFEATAVAPETTA